MRRSTIFVALVAAALILFGAVGSASAQTASGSSLESNLECICFDNVTDTGELCLTDALCNGLTDCTTNGQADCAAGETCIDAVNGCNMAVCLSGCATTHSACGDTHVFGAGEPFSTCPDVNVTRTKVTPKGKTTNAGTWKCRNPTSWGISAFFIAGTTGLDLAQAVADLLNSGVPTDGGFSAADCTASFSNPAGGSILSINCPDGDAVEIAFSESAEGPFVFETLEGASLNGVTFTVRGIPTLSQWGLLALVTLMLLGGTVIILRKRGAQPTA